MGKRAGGDESVRRLHVDTRGEQRAASSLVLVAVPCLLGGLILLRLDGAVGQHEVRSCSQLLQGGNELGVGELEQRREHIHLPLRRVVEQPEELGPDLAREEPAERVLRVCVQARLERLQGLLARHPCEVLVQVAAHELRHHETAVEEGPERIPRGGPDPLRAAPGRGQVLTHRGSSSQHRDDSVAHHVAGVHRVVGPREAPERPALTRLHPRRLMGQGAGRREVRQPLRVAVSSSGTESALNREPQARRIDPIHRPQQHRVVAVAIHHQLRPHTSIVIRHRRHHKIRAGSVARRGGASPSPDLRGRGRRRPRRSARGCRSGWR